jgi:hypothetical protein
MYHVLPLTQGKIALCSWATLVAAQYFPAISPVFSKWLDFVRLKMR